MPYVIILCGPPGSGKTTYVNEYLSDDFITLSLDAIVFKEATRVGKSYEEIWCDYVVTAEELYNAMLSDHLNNGSSIVIDKTHLDAKSRKKTLNKIPPYYKKVAIYFPAYTPEILEKRIKQRAEQGGHNVPSDVIKSMYQRYQLPQNSEGFDLCISSSFFLNVRKIMEFK